MTTARSAMDRSKRKTLAGRRTRPRRVSSEEEEAEEEEGAKAVAVTAVVKRHI